MISLDFRLTSGQVKVLLQLYHDRPLNRMSGAVEDTYPALQFVETPMRVQILATLRSKGLAEHYTEQRRGDTAPWQYTRITDQGRAMARMVVEQAHKIIALDESRKLLEAHNAHARAEMAAGVDLHNRPNNPKPQIVVRYDDAPATQKPRIRIMPDGTYVVVRPKAEPVEVPS